MRVAVSTDQKFRALYDDKSSPLNDHRFRFLDVNPSLKERVDLILKEQTLKPVELAKAAGVTKGLVSQWQKGDRQSMGYDAATRLSRKYGYAVKWLINGEPPKTAGKSEAISPEDLSAKEGILLYLYRGLFSLQQERLIVSLRALFEANQITRKELDQKPLRGVSDEDVRKAFGDAPFLRMKRVERKRRSPNRDLGDAMGDFLDE